MVLFLNQVYGILVVTISAKEKKIAETYGQSKYYP